MVQTRAVGAEVAHFPDTEGVTSSNLVSPTIFLLYVAPSGALPITRFTVPHCLRWQADTRYLRFEGLISRSRNIYLRFKGLPKRDIRSMRGHPALESCGFRPGSTRAPTPRNAVRCLSEPQSTPRNEDSPRISRSSFERRMCSTVKHADEQACQRRNDPSQLELLQRQHVQYGL